MRIVTIISLKPGIHSTVLAFQSTCFGIMTTLPDWCGLLQTSIDLRL